MYLSQGAIVDEKYQISALLGKGGMGYVYEAIQLHLGRPVALKIMTQVQDADSQSARTRFEREAIAINALKHRNIVSFYGYGIWNDMPYMVMELLQGTSLDQILSGNKILPPQQAIALITQLCQGISCAHTNGVIHRDLKPSNVMLVSNGNESLVKIIDFGLAKVSASTTGQMQQLTQEGLALGSVTFMSPEQCQALPIDQRSDIYAVGCILQQCLTGAPPFLSDNALLIMSMHVSSEPAKLLDYGLSGETEDKLQTVLNKALAKSPEDRYQTIDEMIQDLQRISSGKLACSFGDLKDLAENPKQYKHPEATTKMPRRLPMKVPLLLASFAALIAVISFLLSPKMKNHPEPSDTANSLYRNLDHDITREDKASTRQRESIIERARQVLKQNDIDHTLGDQETIQAHSWIAHQLLKLNRFEQSRDTAIQTLKYQREKRAPQSPQAIIAFNDGVVATCKQLPRKKYEDIFLSYIGPRPTEVYRAAWDDGLVELGNLYFYTGDSDKAADICKRLDPYKLEKHTEENLNHLLAKIALAQGNPEAAWKHALISLKDAKKSSLNKNWPENPEILIPLSRAAVGTNRLKEAQNYLNIYEWNAGKTLRTQSIQICILSKENKWNQIELWRPAEFYTHPANERGAFEFGYDYDLRLLQKAAADAGRTELANKLAEAYRQMIDNCRKIQ